MNYPPEQAALFLREAQKALDVNEADDLKLQRLWWTLIFLRSSCLARDVRRLVGDRVQSGPFKEMQLALAQMAGNYAPHLLGCYEHELHETMERAIADGYEALLNIGCAFGYYSVGLALRMPKARIYSFDISEQARAMCLANVRLNGVEDRTTINGEFRGEDFAAHTGQKTLLLVDIEGAEKDLLNPERYPALCCMDVIVEMHDFMDKDISKTLLARFAPTHDCAIIRNKPELVDFEAVLGPDKFVDPFDQLIAGWDSRDGFTPWGVFRVKR